MHGEVLPPQCDALGSGAYFAMKENQKGTKNRGFELKIVQTKFIT